ncbi:DUF6308 family protein [Micromonospora sp. NPDC050686]|uniref:DUF6308 family protein n=1 Tax=Micromonospora sp. NPDC050686 TaxID=3154631 RepID=UPI0034087DE6
MTQWMRSQQTTLAPGDLRVGGIGRFTAGKLFARKRSRLVPVYDSVVVCTFGTGSSVWEWLHGRLGAEATG